MTVEPVEDVPVEDVPVEDVPVEEEHVAGRHYVAEGAAVEVMAEDLDWIDAADFQRSGVAALVQ